MGGTLTKPLEYVRLQMVASFSFLSPIHLASVVTQLPWRGECS